MADGTHLADEGAFAVGTGGIAPGDMHDQAKAGQCRPLFAAPIFCSPHGQSQFSPGSREGVLPRSRLLIDPDRSGILLLR